MSTACQRQQRGAGRNDPVRRQSAVDWGNSPYGEYFQGLIDEIRVYNRALSQAEIQTDMATPVAAGGAGYGAAERTERA